MKAIALTAFAICVAAILAGCTPAYACSGPNSSCNPSKGVVCCESDGLLCLDSAKLPTNGPGNCRRVSSTPTTSSTVTSTTRPPGSTTTTSSTVPPPALGGIPSRWENPEFVSRAYRDSQSILWDPRGPGAVQEYATQYDRQTRVETMWGPFFAELMSFVCTNGTRQQCSETITLTKKIVKFVVRYNFRDPGEPYGWGPNYVWDHWQALLGVVSEVRAARPPLVAALVRADYVVKPRGKKVPARDRDGIFDPQIRFAPLSDAQADALDAAGASHDRHAHALLDYLRAMRDGKPAAEVARLKAIADGLGPAVRATQAAFTATARNRFEATIFDQVFAGGITIVPGDDFADVDRAIALTEDTIRKHHLWHGGFNARTGQPPNQSLVILAMWSHWLTHLRRATPVPLLMAEPLFDETELTPTGIPWAKFYPRCTRASVLNGTYDNHTCPDIVR